jgi:hypothetical protein
MRAQSCTDAWTVPAFPQGWATSFLTPQRSSAVVRRAIILAFIGFSTRFRPMIGSVAAHSLQYPSAPLALKGDQCLVPRTASILSELSFTGSMTRRTAFDACRSLRRRGGHRLLPRRNVRWTAWRRNDIGTGIEPRRQFAYKNTECASQVWRRRRV